MIIKARNVPDECPLLVRCYFDEQNYTEETCDDCGLTFDVDVYTSTTWTCSPRLASAIRRAKTQGGSVADESATREAGDAQ